MNVDIWVAIIQTAGVVLGSSGVTAIVMRIVENKRRNEESYFLAAIESMHEIYDCLNSVLTYSGCSRALVLYSENGGGIPQGRSDLFVTISHEMHKDSESVRHKVQRLPVDYSYIRMLNALLSSESKSLYMQTDKLEPGLLRDVFEESGTTQAIVFLLPKTKNKLYYCFFNFKSQEKISEQCFRNCTLQAAKINQIIKNDQKRLNQWWKRR